jgi:hypothetical protein
MPDDLKIRLEVAAHAAGITQKAFVVRALVDALDPKPYDLQAAVYEIRDSVRLLVNRRSHRPGKIEIVDPGISCEALQASQSPQTDNPAVSDAAAALIAMGVDPATARQKAARAAVDRPDADAAALIKLALNGKGTPK